MEILSLFSERLKELMDDNGLNTLSLQKISGIRNNNISNWLNKKVVPSTRHILTLSKCFNCSVDFLLGRVDLPEIASLEFESSLNMRLKSLSKEIKKTLHTVAIDLNIDETILYRWGRGKYIPNVESLVMLADYFQCSVDYLIGRK